MLFPPDVLLVLRSHGSQEIVGVHEHVNKCVEKAEEGGMSPRDPTSPGPDGKRHDAVVNNVQQRNVRKFFARHKTELGKILEKKT